MNMKGKMGAGGLIIGIVFAIILIAAIFMVVPNAQIGGEDKSAACEKDTLLTVNGYDAINKGTSVTVVTSAKVNGGVNKVITSGTTKFEPDDRLELLVGADNYLNTTEEIVLECGMNEIDVAMAATDDGTLTIFNDAGNAVSDQGYGAAGVNQSESSTPIQNEIKVTANTDEVLGELVVVLEYSNSTEVDDLVLSGDGVSKLSDTPEVYTEQGTANIVRTYEIKNAPSDGTSKVYFLNIEPESGYTIGAGDNGLVNVTMYTKQWYVDLDGEYKYGIENSDGTLKYEDVFDFGYTIWTS